MLDTLLPHELFLNVISHLSAPLDIHHLLQTCKSIHDRREDILDQWTSWMDKQYCLHWAATNDEVQLCARLIRVTPGVTVVDEKRSGRLALEHAIMRGHIRIVKTLTDGLQYLGEVTIREHILLACETKPANSSRTLRILFRHAVEDIATFPSADKVCREIKQMYRKYFAAVARYDNLPALKFLLGQSEFYSEEDVSAMFTNAVRWYQHIYGVTVIDYLCTRRPPLPAHLFDACSHFDSR